MTLYKAPLAPSMSGLKLDRGATDLRLSVGDIAPFADTPEAPVAGIGLGDFLHVTAWRARVCAQPGFILQ